MTQPQKGEKNKIGYFTQRDWCGLPTITASQLSISKREKKGSDMPGNHHLYQALHHIHIAIHATTVWTLCHFRYFLDGV